MNYGQTERERNEERWKRERCAGDKRREATNRKERGVRKGGKVADGHLLSLSLFHSPTKENYGFYGQRNKVEGKEVK